MFKRVVWLGTGFGLGIGSTVWAKRTVKKKVQRYAPEHVRAQVGNRLRAAGNEVKTAMAEGRETMRRFESESRADVRAQERRRQMRAVGSDG